CVKNLWGRGGGLSGGFPAKEEGVEGERSGGGNPPRTGLARRESGRAGTRIRRANACAGGGLRDSQAVSDGANSRYTLNYALKNRQRRCASGGTMTQKMLAVLVAFIAPLFVFQSVQAYPDRPIKVVVPSPAGGPPDQMARLISDKMAAVLGQPG